MLFSLRRFLRRRTRGSLRLRCSCRMRCRLGLGSGLSVRGNRLSRCWRLGTSRGRLRLSRLSRLTSGNRLCCFVLAQASCRRFVLGCLILVRPSCSSPTFSCLVLGRLILGSLTFSGLIFNCLVLGRFILDSRCFVSSSRLFGRYDSCTAKLARLGSRSDCRPSLVHGGQERMVGTGSVDMLSLHRGCRHVMLTSRCLFCRGRPGGNSAGAAVIAHMVDCRFIDYGFLVNIVNACDVDVIHRAVVLEGPVVPISASIAETTVAEAVVDAAVEADACAPVPAIPGVRVVIPSPVTGSP